MSAILSNWLYIPRSELTLRDVATLRHDLTVVPKNFAAQRFRAPQPVIRMYDEQRSPGYIGVPRSWGLDNYRGDIVNQTVFGEHVTFPKRPNPHHPRVREPAKQAQFMADLIAGARNYGSFIASGSTGSGKTVAALNMAAELSNTTLVVVHLERLLRQWVKEIKDKLGATDDEVGIVQGPRCDFRGKKIVVAMLQSLSLREYDPELYSYFGTVIFDEVHRIGSEHFSKAVSMFNARVQIGLSATATRKDGADRVFFSHLGPIRVTSEAEALPIDVYAIPYVSAYAPPEADAPTSQKVAFLATDPSRNALIVSQINKMYSAGRQAIVVGASIPHLQGLMAMCGQNIPAEKMGLFTGEYVTDDGSRKKHSTAHLDNVQATAQIVFATYQMMTEGIDIPRLDAGLDATPRSDATQLIGRIRRPVPGKKTPIWVTIVDHTVGSFRNAYSRRSKDYVATGCHVRTMKEVRGTPPARKVDHSHDTSSRT